MVPAITPGSFLLIWRLMSLLVAFGGFLTVVFPGKMTRWQMRRRGRMHAPTGDAAVIEPSPMRLLWMRIVGVFVGLGGLAFASGAVF